METLTCGKQTSRLSIDAHRRCHESSKDRHNLPRKVSHQGKFLAHTSPEGNAEVFQDDLVRLSKSCEQARHHFAGSASRCLACHLESLPLILSSPSFTVEGPAALYPGGASHFKYSQLTSRCRVLLTNQNLMFKKWRSGNREYPARRRRPIVDTRDAVLHQIANIPTQ